MPRKILTRILSWSFSRWSVFRTCKLQAQFKYVDKRPENPRPLPPGKTEHANVRGTRIHEAGETWVKAPAQRPLIPELRSFQPEFEVARQLYGQGRLVMEQDWYFDDAWRPLPSHASSKDIWLRVKADLIAWLTPTHAVFVDEKTGKRYKNEIKHAEQQQLYQLSGFIKYQDLQLITNELWYTDLDELHDMTFTRDFGMRYFDSWNKRGLEITQTTDFQPDPSVSNCRFCPYRNGSNKWVVGTGDCNLNPPDDKFDDPDELYLAKLKEICGE